MGLSEGHGSRQPLKTKQQKVKILNLFSLVLWGQTASHVVLNWRDRVSVGDGDRGTTLPELVDLNVDGRVCVRGWRGWHTRAGPLSADSENMFAWDKSTKTHPSTGSKYALRHCWHGVNNLTLTEVGEAHGKMETVTEREMDWTVIDIQFELLQIFPFSTQLSTLWSARCRTSESDFSVLHTGMVWSKPFANNPHPCGRNVNKCDISPHDLVPPSEHRFRTK